MTTPNKTNRSIPLPTWYSVSTGNDDGTVSSMGGDGENDSIFGYGKTKPDDSCFDDDIEESSVGTMSVMEESLAGGSLAASSNHWYFWRKKTGETASSNVDSPTTKVEHTQDSEEVIAQGSLEQPKLQAGVMRVPKTMSKATLAHLKSAHSRQCRMNIQTSSSWLQPSTLLPSAIHLGSP